MGLELLEQMKSKASKLNKTIILPESHDERVLKAAEILTKEKTVTVVTLGNEEKISEDAKKQGVNLAGIKIIDHTKHEKFEEFSNLYYELRKKKGMTPEQAKETIKRDLFFAAMMLREGLIDGSVAGSFASTGDVMKAGIQIVGMPEGISIVSSFFLMLFPDKTYNFADCAVVPNPDAAQLADIAISTADNHKKLTGEEPLIAMLHSQQKEAQNTNLPIKLLRQLILFNKNGPIFRLMVNFSLMLQ